MGINYNIDDDIVKSAEWLNACSDCIGGSRLNNSHKNKIAAALFYLALEHHGAIQHLVSIKPYQDYCGSASALLRPQFESYIRGVWFHYFANDQEISRFLRKLSKYKFPPITQLMECIETVKGYDKGELKKAKDKIWALLNDFTHGGYVQIASHISDTEIGSNCTDEHMHGLIYVACSTTLLVSTAFADLLDNEKMRIDIFSRYKKLFQQQLIGND